MKRYIILSLTLGVIGILLTWVTFPEAVTIISTGAGNMLRSIGSQNATDDGSGNLTLEVDTLENPVTFDNYSGQMRWSTGDSRLEYSNDAGTTWNDFVVTQVGTLSNPTQFENYSGYLRWNTSASQIEFSTDGGSNYYPLGEGSSTQYGLIGNGTGILAQSTYSSAALTSAFGLTDWHFSAAIIKDDLADAGSLLKSENTRYSATRFDIGIDVSNHLYVTVGTTIEETPATVIYTDTATLTSADIGVPLVIDVMFDGTGDTITFCVNGFCSTSQAATTDFQSYATTTFSDVVSIGSGFNGTILFETFGSSASLPILAHTEITYDEATWQLYFNEKNGATVEDAIGSIDLAVDAGTWTTYEGYDWNVVAADYSTSISHDDLQDVTANEHLDWTADLGTTNINTNNLIISEIDHDGLLNYTSLEHIDWTAAAQNFETSGNVTATGFLNYSSNPAYPKIYQQSVEPDIPAQSVAYWLDTDNDMFYLVADNSTNQHKQQLTDSILVSYKSYNLTSQGLSSGAYYVAGYYKAPADDVTLTQASLTQTYGEANVGYGAHAFVVAAGDGTTDGTDLVITVSGTSMTDAGVRTLADSEVIVSNATSGTLTANTYAETAKKWIGTVTYTLSSTEGTTYSVSFNYGLCKYDDFSNRDFILTDFEAVGLANANDSGFDIELLYHTTTGWTYSAAAFVPGTAALVSFSTDYSTESLLDADEYFAYKRAGLSQFVDGNGSEGVLVRVTQGELNVIEEMNVHLGVQYQ